MTPDVPVPLLLLRRASQLPRWARCPTTPIERDPERPPLRSRSAARSRPPGRRPPEPTHRGWLVVALIALLAVAGFLIWYFVFRSDGGEETADVALSSSNVDFGDQDLGKRSAAQSLTLTNSGSQPSGSRRSRSRG